MQDLNNLGLNQATVSTVGCIITTLLGAYGQRHQIQKIWKNKSAEQVSAVMSIVMFTLFASYLVRGIAEHRLMYLAQGSIRTALFIPIVIGVIRFGIFTNANWIGLVLGFVALVFMSAFDSFRVTGFATIMYIGVIGAGHQAWKVRKANGQVSFSLYLTMLASVSFQSWYGLYYNDTALVIPCLGFVAVYSTILILMVRNKIKTNNTIAEK